MTKNDYAHNLQSLQKDIDNNYSLEMKESFVEKLLGENYKELLMKYFEVIQNNENIIIVRKENV